MHEVLLASLKKTTTFCPIAPGLFGISAVVWRMAVDRMVSAEHWLEQRACFCLVSCALCFGFLVKVLPSACAPVDVCWQNCLMP